MASKSPGIRARRWFTFSLRTLLVMVAVFALWFGRQIHTARAQREAVAALTACHGSIYYDFQMPVDLSHSFGAIRTPRLRPPGTAWLTELLGVDFFNTIVAVRISYEPGHETDEILNELQTLSSLRVAQLSSLGMHDSDVERLSRLVQLEQLYLSANFLTGSSLHHLAMLRKLQTLDLSSNSITDEGLRLPLLPTLETLNLENTAITDACLDQIAELPSLRSLTLSATKVTQAGIRRLQQSRPTLTIVFTAP